MVVSVSVGRRALDVVVFLLTDIKLAPHNGLDPHLVRRIHKMNSPKNIAMVGHGNGRHSQLVHTMDQLVHIAGAIEHGIVGMEVEMNELGH